MRTPRQLAAGLVIAMMLAGGIYLAVAGGSDASHSEEPADASVVVAVEAGPDLAATSAPELEDGEATEPEAAAVAERTAQSDGAKLPILLRIEGRVLGPAGQGLAGAEVQVALRPRPPGERGGRGGRDPRDGPRRKVETDGQGRFTLEGPAFESTLVEVAAQRPGFAPNLVYREWQPAQGVLKIDVDLVTGATVLGRVTSAAGTPLVASVRFRPEDKPAPWRWGELVGVRTTAENGSFELQDVPPGKFVLIVEAPRHVPATTAEAECPSSSRRDLGTIMLEGGVELMGVVLDRDGQPVAGASVEASVVREIAEQRARRELEQRGRIRNPAGDRDVQRRLRDQVSVRRRARTDTEGAFALDGLPRQALRIDVRHEKYLDETRQPIEAGLTARIEIRLHRRLAIQGTVTDGSRGGPIEVFGIQARRIQDPGQPKPPNAQARDDLKARIAEVQEREASVSRAQLAAEAALASARIAAEQERDAAARSKLVTAATTAQQRAQEVAARAQRLRDERARLERERAKQIADEEARQAQQAAQRQANDAWLTERLGSSRQVPGPTPKPTAHAGGAFLLEGLQPGTYVLDVAAPGCVKVAAGPITLRREVPSTTFHVRLERGAEIEGVVLDKANGAPIAGAEITVFVPPRQEQAPSSDPLVQALRPPDQGLRLERVTTDDKGCFKVPAQRGGAYKLIAKAEGFGSLVETLMVPAGQTVSGLVFQLGQTARIFGRVANVRPNEKVQVVMASTNGNRRFVDVSAPAGDYEARDLEPGDWFVRVHHPERKGGPFRQLMEALVRPGMGRPDVRLAEGAAIRLDLDADAEDLGSVVGHVAWNGAPARGFDVFLRPTNPGALPQSSDPEGQRLLRRVLTNALRGKTDQQGQFEIAMVPPGAYLLEVGRGGSLRQEPDLGRGPGRPPASGGPRGNETLVHRQDLFVAKGRPTSVAVSFATGHLRLVLADAQSGKPVSGSRIVLALASEAVSTDPRTWRTLPSTRQVNVRGGVAEVRDVASGDYVFSVFGGGVTPQTGRLYVSSGSTAERRLSVQRASPPNGAQKGAPGQGGRKG